MFVVELYARLLNIAPFDFTKPNMSRKSIATRQGQLQVQLLNSFM